MSWAGMSTFDVAGEGRQATPRLGLGGSVVMTVEGADAERPTYWEFVVERTAEHVERKGRPKEVWEKEGCHVLNDSRAFMLHPSPGFGFGLVDPAAYRPFTQIQGDQASRESLAAFEAESDEGERVQQIRGVQIGDDGHGWGNHPFCDGGGGAFSHNRKLPFSDPTRSELTCYYHDVREVEGLSSFGIYFDSPTGTMRLFQNGKLFDCGDGSEWMANCATTKFAKGKQLHLAVAVPEGHTVTLHTRRTLREAVKVSRFAMGVTIVSWGSSGTGAAAGGGGAGGGGAGGGGGCGGGAGGGGDSGGGGGGGVLEGAAALSDEGLLGPSNVWESVDGRTCGVLFTPAQVDVFEAAAFDSAGGMPDLSNTKLSDYVRLLHSTHTSPPHA